jgi:hypothetical protein
MFANGRCISGHGCGPAPGPTLPPRRVEPEQPELNERVDRALDRADFERSRLRKRRCTRRLSKPSKLLPDAEEQRVRHHGQYARVGQFKFEGIHYVAEGMSAAGLCVARLRGVPDKRPHVPHKRYA